MLGWRDLLMMILVVEDHETVRRSIVRVARHYGDVIEADSIRDAHRRVRSLKPTEAIVDVGLPDGSGLDLIDDLRAKWPRLAVLVLTGDDSRETINRAQALGAQYAIKPIIVSNLHAFLRMRPAWLLSCSLTEFASEKCLTPREVELVRRMLVEDTPRSHIGRAMDITENTVKTLTKRLLRKAGEKHLDDLIVMLRTRADEIREQYLTEPE